MRIRICLLLLSGLGALMFPGCGDDVDAPIDDRFTRSKETPAQEVFTPDPISRRTLDTETDTDTHSDTDTNPYVAPGF